MQGAWYMQVVLRVKNLLFQQMQILLISVTFYAKKKSLFWFAKSFDKPSVILKNIQQYLKKLQECLAILCNILESSAMC